MKPFLTEDQLDWYHRQTYGVDRPKPPTRGKVHERISSWNDEPTILLRMRRDEIHDSVRDYNNLRPYDAMTLEAINALISHRVYPEHENYTTAILARDRGGHTLDETLARAAIRSRRDETIYAAVMFLEQFGNNGYFVLDFKADPFKPSHALIGDEVKAVLVNIWKDGISNRRMYESFKSSVNNA